MRIIVASPSKTGNVWMKNLLARTYALKILKTEPGIPVEELQEFVWKGGFEKNSIFHQHFRPSAEFFELVDAEAIRLVTTIRHPYDVFVSLYFYIQRFDHLFEPGTHFYPLVGKPIDHPDVLDYLARGQDGFGMQVDLALSWLQSGRSIISRYEDLVADTVGELTAVAGRLAPVSRWKIRRAVSQSRAKKMRKQSQTLAGHIRSGTSGDWRNHLTAAHLDVLNASCADQIQALGYQISTSSPAS